MVDGFQVAPFFAQFRELPIRCVYLSAKIHNALDHLIGGFPDSQNLSVGERNYRVRRNINVLNQI
jgi:hypothetical protein